MESVLNLPRATLEALMRDWSLWVAILSITLVFMIYLYLFPTAVEFFTCAQNRDKTNNPGKITSQQ